MIIPDSQFDAAAQSVAQPDTDPLDRAASQVAGDQKVQLRASLYSSLIQVSGQQSPAIAR